jgi:hypothetical protein
MPETENPQGRERLLERLDRVVASLSQPLSRAERKAGWSPEAATALFAHFEHVRDRLRALAALDPRTLPAGHQAIRGLDAWGIDIESDSALAREVVDLADELRSAGRAGRASVAADRWPPRPGRASVFPRLARDG